ncbi:hypothetical protein M885DRAFT_614214 [Pelagophyceae sp. CCMP2097]|nr:hypothetical protein M885DRAFT_614214 [Pelagophyceae sp. CCMP2097]
MASTLPGALPRPRSAALQRQPEPLRRPSTAHPAYSSRAVEAPGLAKRGAPPPAGAALLRSTSAAVRRPALARLPFRSQPGPQGAHSPGDAWLARAAPRVDVDRFAPFNCLEASGDVDEARFNEAQTWITRALNAFADTMDVQGMLAATAQQAQLRGDWALHKAERRLTRDGAFEAALRAHGAARRHFDRAAALASDGPSAAAQIQAQHRRKGVVDAFPRRVSAAAAQAYTAAQQTLDAPARGSVARAVERRREALRVARDAGAAAPALLAGASLERLEASSAVHVAILAATSMQARARGRLATATVRAVRRAIVRDVGAARVGTPDTTTFAAAVAALCASTARDDVQEVRRLLGQHGPRIAHALCDGAHAVHAAISQSSIHPARALVPDTGAVLRDELRAHVRQALDVEAEVGASPAARSTTAADAKLVTQHFARLALHRDSGDFEVVTETLDAVLRLVDGRGAAARLGAMRAVDAVRASLEKASSRLRDDAVDEGRAAVEAARNALLEAAVRCIEATPENCGLASTVLDDGQPTFNPSSLVGPLAAAAVAARRCDARVLRALEAATRDRDDARAAERAGAGLVAAAALRTPDGASECGASVEAALRLLMCLVALGASKRALADAGTIHPALVAARGGVAALACAYVGAVAHVAATHVLEGADVVVAHAFEGGDSRTSHAAARLLCRVAATLADAAVQAATTFPSSSSRDVVGDLTRCEAALTTWLDAWRSGFDGWHPSSGGALSAARVQRAATALVGVLAKARHVGCSPATVAVECLAALVRAERRGHDAASEAPRFPGPADDVGPDTGLDGPLSGLSSPASFVPSRGPRRPKVVDVEALDVIAGAMGFDGALDTAACGLVSLVCRDVAHCRDAAKCHELLRKMACCAVEPSYGAEACFAAAKSLRLLATHRSADVARAAVRSVALAGVDKWIATLIRLAADDCAETAHAEVLRALLETPTARKAHDVPTDVAAKHGAVGALVQHLRLITAASASRASDAASEACFSAARAVAAAVVPLAAARGALLIFHAADAAPAMLSALRAFGGDAHLFRCAFSVALKLLVSKPQLLDRYASQERYDHGDDARLLDSAAAAVVHALGRILAIADDEPEDSVCESGSPGSGVAARPRSLATLSVATTASSAALAGGQQAHLALGEAALAAISAALRHRGASAGPKTAVAALDVLADLLDRDAPSTAAAVGRVGVGRDVVAAMRRHANCDVQLRAVEVVQHLAAVRHTAARGAMADLLEAGVVDALSQIHETASVSLADHASNNASNNASTAPSKAAHRMAASSSSAHLASSKSQTVAFKASCASKVSRTTSVSGYDSEGSVVTPAQAHGGGGDDSREAKRAAAVAVATTRALRAVAQASPEACATVVASALGGVLTALRCGPVDAQRAVAALALVEAVCCAQPGAVQLADMAQRHAIPDAALAAIKAVCLSASAAPRDRTAKRPYLAAATVVEAACSRVFSILAESPRGCYLLHRKAVVPSLLEAFDSLRAAAHAGARHGKHAKAREADALPQELRHVVGAITSLCRQLAVTAAGLQSARPSARQRPPGREPPPPPGRPFRSRPRSAPPASPSHSEFQPPEVADFCPDATSPTARPQSASGSPGGPVRRRGRARDDGDFSPVRRADDFDAGRPTAGKGDSLSKACADAVACEAMLGLHKVVSRLGGAVKDAVVAELGEDVVRVMEHLGPQAAPSCTMSALELLLECLDSPPAAHAAMLYPRGVDAEPHGAAANLRGRIADMAKDSLHREAQHVDIQGLAAALLERISAHGPADAGEDGGAAYEDAAGLDAFVPDVLGRSTLSAEDRSIILALRSVHLTSAQRFGRAAPDARGKLTLAGRTDGTLRSAVLREETAVLAATKGLLGLGSDAAEGGLGSDAGPAADDGLGKGPSLLKSRSEKGPSLLKSRSEKGPSLLKSRSEARMQDTPDAQRRDGEWARALCEYGAMHAVMDTVGRMPGAACHAGAAMVLLCRVLDSHAAATTSFGTAAADGSAWAADGGVGAADGVGSAWAAAAVAAARASPADVALQCLVCQALQRVVRAAPEAMRVVHAAGALPTLLRAIEAHHSSSLPLIVAFHTLVVSMLALGAATPPSHLGAREACLAGAETDRDLVECLECIAAVEAHAVLDAGTGAAARRLRFARTTTVAALAVLANPELRRASRAALKLLGVLARSPTLASHFVPWVLAEPSGPRALLAALAGAGADVQHTCEAAELLRAFLERGGAAAAAAVVADVGDAAVLVGALRAHILEVPPAFLVLRAMAELARHGQGAAALTQCGVVKTIFETLELADASAAESVALAVAVMVLLAKLAGGEMSADDEEVATMCASLGLDFIESNVVLPEGSEALIISAAAFVQAWCPEHSAQRLVTLHRAGLARKLERAAHTVLGAAQAAADDAAAAAAAAASGPARRPRMHRRRSSVLAASALDRPPVAAPIASAAEARDASAAEARHVGATVWEALGALLHVSLPAAESGGMDVWEVDSALASTVRALARLFKVSEPPPAWRDDVAPGDVFGAATRTFLATATPRARALVVVSEQVSSKPNLPRFATTALRLVLALARPKNAEAEAPQAGPPRAGQLVVATQPVGAGQPNVAASGVDSKAATAAGLEAAIRVLRACHGHGRVLAETAHFITRFTAGASTLFGFKYLCTHGGVAALAKVLVDHPFETRAVATLVLARLADAMPMHQSVSAKYSSLVLSTLHRDGGLSTAMAAWAEAPPDARADAAARALLGEALRLGWLRGRGRHGWKHGEGDFFDRPDASAASPFDDDEDYDGGLERAGAAEDDYEADYEDDYEDEPAAEDQARAAPDLAWVVDAGGCGAVAKKLAEAARYGRDSEHVWDRALPQASSDFDRRAGSESSSGDEALRGDAPGEAWEDAVDVVTDVFALSRALCRVGGPEAAKRLVGGGAGTSLAAFLLASVDRSQRAAGVMAHFKNMANVGLSLALAKKGKGGWAGAIAVGKQRKVANGADAPPSPAKRTAARPVAPGGAGYAKRQGGAFKLREERLRRWFASGGVFAVGDDADAIALAATTGARAAAAPGQVALALCGLAVATLCALVTDAGAAVLLRKCGAFEAVLAAADLGRDEQSENSLSGVVCFLSRVIKVLCAAPLEACADIDETLAAAVHAFGRAMVFAAKQTSPTGRVNAFYASGGAANAAARVLDAGLDALPLAARAIVALGCDVTAGAETGAAAAARRTWIVETGVAFLAATFLAALPVADAEGRGDDEAALHAVSTLCRVSCEVQSTRRAVDGADGTPPDSVQRERRASAPPVAAASPTRLVRRGSGGEPAPRTPLQANRSLPMLYASLEAALDHDCADSASFGDDASDDNDENGDKCVFFAALVNAHERYRPAAATDANARSIVCLATVALERSCAADGASTAPLGPSPLGTPALGTPAKAAPSPLRTPAKAAARERLRAEVRARDAARARDLAVELAVSAGAVAAVARTALALPAGLDHAAPALRFFSRVLAADAPAQKIDDLKIVARAIVAVVSPLAQEACVPELCDAVSALAALNAKMVYATRRRHSCPVSAPEEAWRDGAASRRFSFSSNASFKSPARGLGDGDLASQDAPPSPSGLSRASRGSQESLTSATADLQRLRRKTTAALSMRKAHDDAVAEVAATPHVLQAVCAAVGALLTAALPAPTRAVAGPFVEASIVKALRILRALCLTAAHVDELQGSPAATVPAPVKTMPAGKTTKVVGAAAAPPAPETATLLCVAVAKKYPQATAAAVAVLVRIIVVHEADNGGAFRLFDAISALAAVASEARLVARRGVAATNEATDAVALREIARALKKHPAAVESVGGPCVSLLNLTSDDRAAEHVAIAARVVLSGRDADTLQALTLVRRLFAAGRLTPARGASQGVLQAAVSRIHAATRGVGKCGKCVGKCADAAEPPTLPREAEFDAQLLVACAGVVDLFAVQATASDLAAAGGVAAQIFALEALREIGNRRAANAPAADVREAVRVSAARNLSVLLRFLNKCVDAGFSFSTLRDAGAVDAVVACLGAAVREARAVSARRKAGVAFGAELFRAHAARKALGAAHRPFSKRPARPATLARWARVQNRISVFAADHGPALAAKAAMMLKRLAHDPGAREHALIAAPGAIEALLLVIDHYASDPRACDALTASLDALSAAMEATRGDEGGVSGVVAAASKVLKRATAKKNDAAGLQRASARAVVCAVRAALRHGGAGDAYRHVCAAAGEPTRPAQIRWMPSAKWDSDVGVGERAHTVSDALLAAGLADALPASALAGDADDAADGLAAARAAGEARVALWQMVSALARESEAFAWCLAGKDPGLRGIVAALEASGVDAACVAAVAATLTAMLRTGAFDDSLEADLTALAAQRSGGVLDFPAFAAVLRAVIGASASLVEVPTACLAAVTELSVCALRYAPHEASQILDLLCAQDDDGEFALAKALDVDARNLSDEKSVAVFRTCDAVLELAPAAARRTLRAGLLRDALRGADAVHRGCISDVAGKETQALAASLVEEADADADADAAAAAAAAAMAAEEAAAAAAAEAAAAEQAAREDDYSEGFASEPATPMRAPLDEAAWDHAAASGAAPQSLVADARDEDGDRAAAPAAAPSPARADEIDGAGPAESRGDETAAAAPRGNPPTREANGLNDGEDEYSDDDDFGA